MNRPDYQPATGFTPLTYKSAQHGFQPLAEPLRNFGNGSVVCEGWYPVRRSRSLRVGKVDTIEMGQTSLVLYRSLAGVPHAVERQCAHLGADLAHARVVEKGLQCAFHRWCWGADGTCAAGGGVAERRRIRVYPVRDLWGILWVWAGPESEQSADEEPRPLAPRYEMPTPDPANSRHIVRLPEQTLDCHPHVILGNGLDFTHVGPVHRFHLLEDPQVTVEPAPRSRVSVEIHTRFSPTFMRSLLRLSNVSAHWRFTTIGPSLAWLTVYAPTPFELVWAGRPLADGRAAMQTVLFLPRYTTFLRALPMMIATTFHDKHALDHLRFRPGFVASDAVFKLYAEQIEALPRWVESGHS